ncbi:FAD/NAD(P)-binding domain-containing protein [Xylariaceae sp. FL0662B]|nr:FAD/NAD(P)-binding domain-containing protein [Xylariaceae sp. FL0662B]
MCAIALKHAGHTVTVLEKHGNERQSHMAGVCLGLDAENFLIRHDVLDRAFSQESYKVQALEGNETVQRFVNARRHVTSWDTFYFRLRSLFDGYLSSYYPSPPHSMAIEGCCRYEYQKEVLDLGSTNDADGPDSAVRTKYLPNVRRKYVGYIAWRGTVPEEEVSEGTREIFKDSITLHMMHRQHCILYAIPGVNGTLEPGKRLLNFLWYTNESYTAIESIMVDKFDGHRHRNVVPAGRVRDDVWEARLKLAQAAPLPRPFLDVITKIRCPFIQVITDLCSPRAAFEDGRVLLVGDAVCLYRPHTAFSATQAAFHALAVQDYIDGKISLREWEDDVLLYSKLHGLQSIWYGTFYQSHPFVALISGLQYLA